MEDAAAYQLGRGQQRSWTCLSPDAVSAGTDADLAVTGGSETGAGEATAEGLLLGVFPAHGETLCLLPALLQRQPPAEVAGSLGHQRQASMLRSHVVQTVGVKVIPEDKARATIGTEVGLAVIATGGHHACSSSRHGVTFCAV